MLARMCSLILLVPVLAAPQQQPTVRSQSSVVLVPALVKDAQDHLIYGLTANDFVIEDDGVPQNIYLDDSAESDPVSIVVAIQTGRRAQREFSRIRRISSMLNPVLEEPGARVAIVEFDNHTLLVRSFTHDSAALDEFRQLQPGDNGAAILDAVKLSASLLAKEPEGRKRILLLVSEMRDHGSHIASIDDVVASIGNSNTIVYALAFSPSLSQVLDTGRGANPDEAYWNAPADLLAPLLMARNAMKKNVTKTIAQMTGGEFEVFTSHRSFEGRMVDFSNHIHNRYVLSFEPHRPHPGLHQIQVRLKGSRAGVTVVSRTSYWVVTNAAATE